MDNVSSGNLFDPSTIGEDRVRKTKMKNCDLQLPQNWNSPKIRRKVVNATECKNTFDTGIVYVLCVTRSVELQCEGTSTLQ